MRENLTRVMWLLRLLQREGLARLEQFPTEVLMGETLTRVDVALETLAA
jgi:hypothetical protein